MFPWLVYFIGCIAANLINEDAELRNKIELGRQQFQLLINDENPDPQCWKENILTLMNEKCSLLNYESRSQTSLKLAICHLKQSGVNNIDAEECNSNIKKCIAGMSISNQMAFSTYNHFFTSIDNICIYVQMAENNKNIQKSIYNLYTATIESADYLIQTNEQNKKFQHEMFDTQNEIKKTNEEIIDFNIKHEKNINNIQTISLNIENKQDTLLQNQQKSIEKQESIYSMQNKFETEMNKMYESQFNEIHNAKNEINKLTKDSQNAYKQIMDMIQDALYILNMIYKMDFKMLQQLLSIQSVIFYIFWCIASYISTIPKCARTVRLISFITIFISIALEQTVASIMSMDMVTNEKNFYDYNYINECCAIIRQSMFGLTVLLYIWFVSKYKDPIKQQIELLKQINIKTQNISRSKSKRVFFMSALKSITPKNIRGLWTKL